MNQQAHDSEAFTDNLTINHSDPREHGHQLPARCNFHLAFPACAGNMVDGWSGRFSKFVYSQLLLWGFSHVPHVIDLNLRWSSRIISWNIIDALYFNVNTTEKLLIENNFSEQKPIPVEYGISYFSKQFSITFFLIFPSFLLWCWGEKHPTNICYICVCSERNERKK